MVVCLRGGADRRPPGAEATEANTCLLVLTDPQRVQPPSATSTSKPLESDASAPSPLLCQGMCVLTVAKQLPSTASTS